MKTLKELREEYFEYVKFRGGFWEIGEFNHRINKFSRAMVRAFRREHGSAFLGNINFYEYTKENYQEYKKGMVRNFEYHFIVPVADDKLKVMIDDRNAAPYTGTKADSERLDPIFDRIIELGGITLNWV